MLAETTENEPTLMVVYTNQTHPGGEEWWCDGGGGRGVEWGGSRRGERCVEVRDDVGWVDRKKRKLFEAHRKTPPEKFSGGGGRNGRRRWWWGGGRIKGEGESSDVGKDEYETWAMKMEYWIMNSDHNLWNIVLNGNSRKKTGRDPKGNIMILPPVSVEEHIAVQRETKARNKYLLLRLFSRINMAGFHNWYQSLVALDLGLIRWQQSGRSEGSRVSSQTLTSKHMDWFTAGLDVPTAKLFLIPTGKLMVPAGSSWFLLVVPAGRLCGSCQYTKKIQEQEDSLDTMRGQLVELNKTVKIKQTIISELKECMRKKESENEHLKFKVVDFTSVQNLQMQVEELKSVNESFNLSVEELYKACKLAQCKKMRLLEEQSNAFYNGKLCFF
ncbi:hypothetical protein Tco_0189718 [Tanacetum coccineum]